MAMKKEVVRKTKSITKSTNPKVKKVVVKKSVSSDKGAPKLKAAASKKKSVSKKPASKLGSVKKSPVKKSPAKKSSTKKSKAKRSTHNPKTPLEVAALTPFEPLESPTLIPDQGTSPVESLESLPQLPAPLPKSESSKKSNKRVAFFALLIPLFALITIFSGNDEDSASPNPVVSESPTPTPKETEPVSARPLPATNVFADYTAIGGVLTWKAPEGEVRPDSYVVEASYAGSDFVAVATLGADITELQLIKVDTPRETVYRVVAKYRNGDAVSDLSSIKGKYEVAE